jgi:hypothetical protein
MLIALIIVGVLIAALLVNAATRPPNFSVQRSLAIKAPPASIYPFIADLRQWGPAFREAGSGDEAPP